MQIREMSMQEIRKNAYLLTQSESQALAHLRFSFLTTTSTRISSGLLIPKAAAMEKPRHLTPLRQLHRQGIARGLVSRKVWPN